MIHLCTVIVFVILGFVQFYPSLLISAALSRASCHDFSEIDFLSESGSVVSASIPHRCSRAGGYYHPFKGRGGYNVGDTSVVMTLGESVYVL